MGLLKRLIVVKNVVMVMVLVWWFLKSGGAERESGRCSRSWSHKASTPSNKNMVGDDGPFRHGPNEPHLPIRSSSGLYLCILSGGR